jgi:hypothetical protein
MIDNQYYKHIIRRGVTIINTKGDNKTSIF